jgi:tetratricopeptide (TPR) repeat protein
MKSLFLTVLLACTAFGVFAQKLDKIKDQLAKNKLAEARNDINSFLANDKNKNNAEGWYTKAKIYNAISKDEALKATVPGARDSAFQALKVYAAMQNDIKEADKRFVSLTVDNRAPLVDLYSGYSKDAAAFYNAGNFNDALENFQRSLEIFDFMTERGWIQNNSKLDTTTTLYAGISAEKAKKPDTAAIYYGKIAENKVKDSGFIEIYKWLADHYQRKGDLESASKYLALGKEVYPTDMFWPNFELDMLREKGDKDALFTKYEQAVNEHPENHLFRFNYAVELYQEGYNADSSKRPANSKELVDKAVVQLQEVLKVKPDFPNANLVMGQILYNQGVEIANENKTIRPPKGGKLKPDQLKQKEELRNQMNAKYDEALKYFEKVDQTLGSQGKLKAEEKGFLKDTYDLMISIYEQKQNNEKVEEYNQKFVNVEKDH